MEECTRGYIDAVGGNACLSITGMDGSTRVLEVDSAATVLDAIEAISVPAASPLKLVSGEHVVVPVGSMLNLVSGGRVLDEQVSVLVTASCRPQYHVRSASS
ncbi:unnamed protein product [Symbiodinium necroappetens]|uniref:Uncharacterized protein n=1 Tax=Symbiodinium necroappetens TaxID=1628268 RepID=A0A812VZ34_9DINO|nr:unnamed protein product [Symbiodinium necroappetens]